MRVRSVIKNILGLLVAGLSVLPGFGAKEAVVTSTVTNMVEKTSFDITDSHMTFKDGFNVPKGGTEAYNTRGYENIIFEDKSPNISKIEGLLDIAGRRAEKLFIVNKNGITVDGGSFKGMNRVVFSALNSGPIEIKCVKRSLVGFCKELSFQDFSRCDLREEIIDGESLKKEGKCMYLEYQPPAYRGLKPTYCPRDPIPEAGLELETLGMPDSFFDKPSFVPTNGASIVVQRPNGVQLPGTPSESTPKDRDSKPVDLEDLYKEGFAGLLKALDDLDEKYKTEESFVSETSELGAITALSPEEILPMVEISDSVSATDSDVAPKVIPWRKKWGVEVQKRKPFNKKTIRHSLRKSLSLRGYYEVSVAELQKVLCELDAIEAGSSTMLSSNGTFESASRSGHRSRGGTLLGSLLSSSESFNAASLLRKLSITPPAESPSLVSTVDHASKKSGLNVLDLFKNSENELNVKLQEVDDLLNRDLWKTLERTRSLKGSLDDSAMAEILKSLQEMGLLSDAVSNPASGGNSSTASSSIVRSVPETLAAKSPNTTVGLVSALAPTTIDANLQQAGDMFEESRLDRVRQEIQSDVSLQPVVKIQQPEQVAQSVVLQNNLNQRQLQSKVRDLQLKEQITHGGEQLSQMVQPQKLSQAEVQDLQPKDLSGDLFETKVSSTERFDKVSNVLKYERIFDELVDISQLNDSFIPNDILEKMKRN